VITLPRCSRSNLSRSTSSCNNQFGNDNIRPAAGAKAGESPQLREIARSQALATDHPASQVLVTLCARAPPTKPSTPM